MSLVGTGLTSAPGTTVYINSMVLGVAENSVNDNGASNALTVNLKNIDGYSVPLTKGLRLLVLTNNTLQAGANTLALNGGATKAITDIYLRSLKTAIAVGAFLDLAYDGTQWQMLNGTDTRII